MTSLEKTSKLQDALKVFEIGIIKTSARLSLQKVKESKNFKPSLDNLRNVLRFWTQPQPKKALWLFRVITLNPWEGIARDSTAFVPIRDGEFALSGPMVLLAH